MAEAPGRVTPGGGALRALPLALAVLASGCVGPVHDLYPPREGEPVTSVWVVSHGWRTGIVVRPQDVPGGLWPQLRDFAGSELVGRASMAPAGASGLALRAAFWPASSVAHLAGFTGPAERHFPAGEIVEITLSRRGFEKLAAFIQEAYATDEAGGAIGLGPGHYPSSRFYLARETYHALKTCNTWTAKALLTAGNVIHQARVFCGGVARLP